MDTASHGGGASPSLSSIDEAIEVIGNNRPRDNRMLEAEDGGRKHIERLLPYPKAAPLIKILRSEAVQDVFQRYSVSDAEANRAQAAYKRSRLWLVLPLGFAISFAVLCFLFPAGTLAGLLGKIGLSEPDAQAYVRLAPVWLLHLASLLTAGLALYLRPLQSYTRWKEARGTAEVLRRELFERVVASDEHAGTSQPTPELPVLLLKLEYFRRYQIELQDAFHRTRGRDHERIADRAKRLGFALISLLILWAGLSILANLSGLTEQGALPWTGYANGTLLAASGVLQRIEIYNVDSITLAVSLTLALAYLGVLLHAFVSSSVRNAARYRIMRENFRTLHAELDRVRAAAQRGDQSAVHNFVARVHSIMSLELADWVRLLDLDRGKDQGATTLPLVQPS